MLIPRSVESEKSVLGALLLDNTAFSKVHKILCANDFTISFHQEIFESMTLLHRKFKSFDVPMIVEDLGISKEHEKYVYELANNCASVVNVKAYAEILREKSVQRQLILVANEIQQAALNGTDTPIDKIMDEAERKVRAIGQIDDSKCAFQVQLASFFRDLSEEIESTDPRAFCESYLHFTLVEVSKALIDLIRHVEENELHEHP